MPSSCISLYNPPNSGFLNNYRVSIIQVKIGPSLPVSAFGHIGNLIMNRLRIDENGSFISKRALFITTEKKKEAKKWLFSHFSRFITTKAIVIAVSDVKASLHIIRAKLKRPFALPELALNRYPIEFILASLQVDLPPLFNLGRRPTQRGTRKTDAMLHAILAVTPGAVDLVRMNGCRIITKALAIGFDLIDQITGFVIGIPTDAIHKRKPITRLADTLAPNSVEAPAFPRLMGRTWG